MDRPRAGGHAHPHEPARRGRRARSAAVPRQRRHHRAQHARHRGPPDAAGARAERHAARAHHLHGGRVRGPLPARRPGGADRVRAEGGRVRHRQDPRPRLSAGALRGAGAGRACAGDAARGPRAARGGRGDRRARGAPDAGARRGPDAGLLRHAARHGALPGAGIHAARVADVRGADAGRLQLRGAARGRVPPARGAHGAPRASLRAPVAARPLGARGQQLRRAHAAAPRRGTRHRRTQPRAVRVHARDDERAASRRNPARGGLGRGNPLHPPGLLAGRGAPLPARRRPHAPRSPPRRHAHRRRVHGQGGRVRRRGPRPPRRSAPPGPRPPAPTSPPSPTRRACWCAVSGSRAPSCTRCWRRSRAPTDVSTRDP